MKGIGFDYDSMNKEIKVPTKKFVFLKMKTEFQMLNHKSQPPARRMYPQYIGYNNSSWRCHHCGIYGHISPYFYRLQEYPQRQGQQRLNRKISKNFQAMKLWKPNKKQLVS